MIYQFSNPNSLVKTKSPSQLTEKGKKTASNIKAKELFDKYKDDLSKSFKDIDNAYDVQKEAMRIINKEIKSVFSQEDILSLKNEAYKIGAPLNDIFLIFFIYLRDHILKEKNLF